jgi:hypothetical protein
MKKFGDRNDTGRLKRRRLPTRRKVILLIAANIAVLATAVILGELGCRFVWKPKYRIECEQWWVGSGMTPAGPKYWPTATYRISSPEFDVRFETDARGYRAPTEPRRIRHPYRIAFVGDSFTEGTQVEYARTFCALLERGLAGSLPDREIVCENYGIAATGLFEYWHRIAHDVLRPDPPDALVLCIYPGNDFTGAFPADGFDQAGRPRRDYFEDPSRARHMLTWLNLNSQLARYLQERILRLWMWLEPPDQAAALWWTSAELASRAAGSPVVRRVRSLFEAIAEDCRRSGTRLCILVIGPVETYLADQGRSPLAQVLGDWKIAAPVIDVAIDAISLPDFNRLLFPRDGHLNEDGHAYICRAALPRLRDVVLSPPLTASDARESTRK